MTDSGSDRTRVPVAITPDGDTLGGRIWHARDALGLSIEALAARLGVPEETVADWERDHAEPRTNALFRLAGVLSVSPSWLIAGIGEAPNEPLSGDDLHPLFRELERVKRLHQQTGAALAALEQELARHVARRTD
ncbi:helix-turn-helix domain-containing protein [Rhizobium sp. TRM95111]|uniref:helix-turn-helix domain-containing protein n=1 Tax=Rhizobium alarense TaxID=2846851 RepID=UPI001F19B529|nr:helix-turn-helix domain-containing protein [Rhizobium alarense]MCF3639761.1 helix-turn-helix domain-containing protein [Rhizobium alarense]